MKVVTVATPYTSKSLHELDGLDGLERRWIVEEREQLIALVKAMVKESARQEG